MNYHKTIERMQARAGDARRCFVAGVMRYGILRKRGWLMQGPFMKQFESAEEALPDLKKGGSLVPLPRTTGSQQNALPGHGLRGVKK